MDSASQTLDVRNLFALLRRQARLITLVTVFTMGLALLAILVMQPMYTASALVLVDPSQKNLLDPGFLPAAGSSESARVDSEVALVKSRSNLLSVVRSESLTNDPLLGPKLGWQLELLVILNIRRASLPSGPEALRQVLSNLDRATSASRLGDTYLISVDATTGDPATSARVANALAEAYIRGQLEAKVNSTQGARDILKARVSGAAKAIADAERAFDTFVSEVVTEGNNPPLTKLRQQIDATEAEGFRLETAVKAARLGLDVQDWDAVVQSLQVDTLAQLDAQRRDLEDKLRGTAEVPQTALPLRQQLADTEANMETAAQSGLADLRERLSASTQKTEDLKQELRSMVLKSNLPADTLTRIYELQQNSQIARAQYDTLLARLGDLETQTYLQIADSRIVSAAFEPSGPSYPNPRLILTLAAIAGLSLGIGLALIYENFLGGFTSEAQATAVLRLPFVSSIPFIRPKPGNARKSHADLITIAPLSTYSESVRRVRLSAELSAQRAAALGKEQRGMVLMVTSASPAEGKTTLALALSRVFTVSGKRTLLIDCDLRNPRVHQHLGIDPSAGLMEYLQRDDNAPPISSILTQDGLGGPAVAIGARSSATPTDQLVAGETFGRLLAAAAKTFDVVVLDTSPVGPVVDALYLSRFADAVILTVKWGTTQQSEVRRAVAALNGGKRPEVEIIGVLQQARGLYTSKQKSAYDGYYHES